MAEQLIPYTNAMQYDGTNSAAIFAALPAQKVSSYGITIVSEDDGVLVFGWESAGPQTTVVPTGDWVIWNDEGIPSVVADALLAGTYIKRSDLP